MSRFTFHPTSTYTIPYPVKRFSPSIGIWGAGAGTAVLLLLSVTPLVKRELLVKLPVLGPYYEDKTPASDKAF